MQHNFVFDFHTDSLEQHQLPVELKLYHAQKTSTEPPLAQSQGVQNSRTNSSTRQTGKTRVTNSQAAIHESCLVRSSSLALRCSRNDLHDINYGRQLILLSQGLSHRQVPARATHTPDSASLVSPSPTDFHTGTIKKYHPVITVYQQEPDPSSLHFHLVAFTRQIRSTCFTPESPLLFSLSIHQCNPLNGSKNSAMVAVATNTFATSMPPYPSQPHVSRGTHLLIKTVYMGPSHTERVPQDLHKPSKDGSLYFITEPLLSISFQFFLH